jgi:hypothetical protein
MASLATSATPRFTVEDRRNLSRKKRTEHLQFALSVLTILFVAAELLAHKHLHGVYL